jgi:hypothetical protein
MRDVPGTPCQWLEKVLLVGVGDSTLYEMCCWAGFEGQPGGECMLLHMCFVPTLKLLLQLL